MKPETAQKLIELLQAIDADNTNDFVDVVCSKYYELPESVIDELQKLIDKPEPNIIAWRVPYPENNNAVIFQQYPSALSHRKIEELCVKDEIK
jgi:hypothetical protein